jgi:hypothetical protein
MALPDCDPAVLEALRAVYREHVPEKTAAEVRKTPSLPGSWASCSLSSRIPTGMYWPTCIVWADLTPFSLEVEEIIAKFKGREAVLLGKVSAVTRTSHSEAW